MLTRRHEIKEIVKTKKENNSETKEKSKKVKNTILIHIWLSLLKFQSPMLNNGFCRATTDKQTHKQTYIQNKN